jgi:hypothetical protein
MQKGNLSQHQNHPTIGNPANATPQRRGQQNWQCSASQFQTKATGKYTAANMDERRGVRSLKEMDSRNTKPNINSVSTELQPPSSEKIAINADDSSQIATHLVPQKILNIDKIVTNRNDSCQCEGIRTFEEWSRGNFITFEISLQPLTEHPTHSLTQHKAISSTLKSQYDQPKPTERKQCKPGKACLRAGVYPTQTGNGATPSPTKQLHTFGYGTVCKPIPNADWLCQSACNPTSNAVHSNRLSRICCGTACNVRG